MYDNAGDLQSGNIIDLWTVLPSPFTKNLEVNPALCRVVKPPTYSYSIFTVMIEQLACTTLQTPGWVGRSIPRQASLWKCLIYAAKLMLSIMK